MMRRALWCLVAVLAEGGVTTPPSRGVEGGRPLKRTDEPRRAAAGRPRVCYNVSDDDAEEHVHALSMHMSVAGFVLM